MRQTIDLKNLEKQAFRKTHQDGLLDIYYGGILISMTTLMYAADSDDFPLVQFSIFMTGMLVSFFIFWAGKKYITTPRLGQVKFGPQRRRRVRILAAVLTGIVLVQVAVFAGTILLWQNPGWAASLGLSRSDQDLERLAVAFIGAMFVGPSTALIAYFSDFTRGYYIAFIASLGVFLMIWFDNPIFMIAAGVLISIPGVILFFRFLHNYPLPPAGVVNG